MGRFSFLSAMRPVPNRRSVPLKNVVSRSVLGARRPVTSTDQLKGLLQGAMDSGTTLVLETSKAQQVTRTTIHDFLQQFRREEKNCILVYKEKHQNYARELGVAGVGCGAIAATYLGFAIGGIVVGIVVGGTIGLAAGALITKAVVIEVQVTKDAITIKPKKNASGKLVGLQNGKV